MISRVALILPMLLLSAAESGQPPSALATQIIRPQQLTNEDIIKMVRAGLSVDNIIAVIQRSEGTFDLSPDGLIELKKSGVPEPILSALLNHRRPAPVASAAPPVAADNPAAPQRIRPGDIVTEINGKPVEDRLQLLQYTYSKRSKVLPVRLNRAGKEVRIRLTATELFDSETRLRALPTLSFCVKLGLGFLGTMYDGILDLSDQVVEFTSFDRKQHFSFAPGEIRSDQSFRIARLHLPDGKDPRIMSCHPGANTQAVVAAVQRNWAGEPLFSSVEGNALPSVGTTSLQPISTTFSDDDIVSAVQQGRTQPNRVHGLVLSDSAKSFMNILAGGLAATGQLQSTTMVPATGFEISVYTPLAWVSEQAARATTTGRTFSVEDVTPEMRRPVLRISAKPSAPPQVGVNLGLDVSSVNGILIKNAARTRTLAPDSTAAVSFGPLHGLLAEFDLIELAAMRDANPRFHIVVQGSNGDIKDFEIKPIHFSRLP